MTQNVEPCPFCGSVPQIHVAIDGRKEAVCKGANCPIHGIFIRIEDWNRRALGGLPTMEFSK